MTDRDRHYEAAGFAGMQVEETQTALAVAKDNAEAAVLAVSNAAGGANSEAARNALQFIAHVRDEIDQLTGVCEQVKAELIRYQGGF